jgi:hypothetical protein
MIVKALSTADFALIQRVLFDQWQLQKCHNRLRAIEVISHPPDIDIFRSFTLELVRLCLLSLFFWRILILFGAV